MHPHAGEQAQALAEAGRHVHRAWERPGGLDHDRGTQVASEQRQVHQSQGGGPYAMHAVRLGVQGIEVRTTGRVTLPVPEPERTRLRALRRGEWPLGRLLERLDELEHELSVLAASTTLPDEPDWDRINGWLHDTYVEHWAATGVAR